MRGIVAAACVALAAAAAGSSPAGEPGQALPDLVVRTPYDLELTSAGPYWRLGFASAASNVGTAPLVVQGRRRSRAELTMAAVQELRRPDGTLELLDGVGRLRYVTSSDHAHWHLTPFMRYELRPAGRDGPLLRDRKTGFCLGDRYDTERKLPGKPQVRFFESRCGLREPWRLGVRQGISVGWGDDYDPTLEGQHVDVTRLPAGRYVLVHRVNESRSLRESRYDNNASSLLIELGWRGGRPWVEQLRRCPGRDTC